MSNENLETVKRCYEAFGRGDLPFIMGCLSDELTRFGFETSPNSKVPWYLPLTRKSDVPRYFEALNAAVEHTRVEPLAFAAGGDYVYATLKLEQRIRKTGQPLVHEAVHRIRFKSGKVIEWRALEDTATIEAAFR
jgi:ketosteroid isomerase-like protein